jgi:uncharacterized membrane protein SpoIIM required for sporulation
MSRSIIERFTPYIALLIMTISFVVGSRVNCYYLNSPVVVESSVIFFFKVILQNSCFAVFLLMGGFFINITTACLLIYNGFSWGKSFKDVYCNAGLEKTVMLVLPHIFLEVFWILFICQISIKISFQFFDLLTNKSSASDLYESFKKQSLMPIIYTFALLIFSASIECFLTPLLYQMR